MGVRCREATLEAGVGYGGSDMGQARTPNGMTPREVGDHLKRPSSEIDWLQNMRGERGEDQSGGCDRSC